MSFASILPLIRKAGMSSKWAIVAIASWSACAFASEFEPMVSPTEQVQPCLVGPLLALPGTVFPKGHYSLQPFVFYTVETGEYDSEWRAQSMPNFYIFNMQLQTHFGLTPWLDIGATPQFFWKRTKNQGAARFGDLPLSLNFQLYPADASWFPGMKFIVQETLPTGKYQRLNPHKLETDASGTGSFATLMGLLFYRVYPMGKNHFMSMTLSGTYTVNTPVEVHGFNNFGGGFGTHGCVLPGNQIQGILSLEWTLTDHWVFGLETMYTHNDKTLFFGKSGVDLTGEKALVGGPSEEQLSFAPEIEYCISQQFGVAAEVWFTAAGRNSERFISGIFSFVYNY